MSRMFCTVKEAAETLHASEDQIKALLEQGILPEFRQGPHRLLRTADIGALDLLRVHGPQAQGPAQPPVPTPPPAPRRRGRTSARSVEPTIQRRAQRGAPAVARPPRPSRAAGSSTPPRTKKAERRTGNQDSRTERRKTAGPDGQETRRQEGCPAPAPCDRLPVPPSYATAVPRPPAVVRPPASTPPAQTLGQWFWMGLVQDRPSAIALLSGLALLALSALAAGICLAAGGF
jgi:excisionase family DNA binding protein